MGFIRGIERNTWAKISLNLEQKRRSYEHLKIEVFSCVLEHLHIVLEEEGRKSTL